MVATLKLLLAIIIKSFSLLFVIAIKLYLRLTDFLSRNLWQTVIYLCISYFFTFGNPDILDAIRRIFLNEAGYYILTPYIK